MQSSPAGESAHAVGEAAEPPRVAWSALTADQALERLGVTPRGLDTARAEKLLGRWGPNALEAAATVPWWRILLRQSMSPLIAILLVAGIITSVQRHWVDAGAIFLVLALNASLGFWQERKAEREVRALASMSITTARVRRPGDDAVHRVPADRLVPGDVVLLDSGDQVPADLRLLTVNGLQVDESMLTGESIAIAKDRRRCRRMPRLATAAAWPSAEPS